MKKNTITYEVSGRLGNQLQLYACARTLSLRYGWEFIYRPLIHEIDLNFSYTKYQKITNIFNSFCRKKVTLDNHDWDSTFNINGSMCKEYTEKQNALFILSWGGVFKDLSEFRENLIREIFPSKLLASEPTFPDHHIAVHVRRDDSNYPLPIEYYVNAVREAKKEAGRSAVIHLFSDGDHHQISSDLQEKIKDTEVVIHKDGVVQDLISMSRFPIIIISMSWFSYWAAFISNDSIIYAPESFCYYPHWKSVT